MEPGRPINPQRARRAIALRLHHVDVIALHAAQHYGCRVTTTTISELWAWLLEAALYALKMYGYRGYFGIDIYPERVPGLKAVELNCKALNIMNERINALDHERMLECYFDPANHRGQLEDLFLDSLRR